MRLDRLLADLEEWRRIAKMEEADEPDRAAAIRLIGRWNPQMDKDLPILAKFLEPATSSSLQSAALENLRSRSEPEVASALLKVWPRQGPAFRNQAIRILLSRDEWMKALLAAIERRSVAPAEIPLPEQQQILKRASASVRERAAKIFLLKDASRADVLANFNTVASLASTPVRGSALFNQNCAQCHAWRGHGHAVGPNLGEFAGKSAADFVQAIFDPNSAINPNFLAYNIETKDGRGLSGVVRGETASGLTLVQGGGVQETILRADIAEIRASNLSLMPEGLELAMSPQDVADLIAWIKQAAPAPFGHASANPDLAAKNRAHFLKSGASRIANVRTAAETLPYRSWIGTLPMAYCRLSAGVNRLAWESTSTPPLTPALSPSRGERENRGAAGGRTAEFRFPAARGFLSQPSGKFTLRVNGTALLDFNVSLADETWQSPDGRARMTYAVTEANTEDSCGVLQIKVAPDLVKPGESARFEVIGSSSGSQRWFGIYELNVAR